MTSPECKCADAPFLELFLKDRNRALDGWDAAADGLDADGGPRTQPALVAEFFKHYKADQRIIDQVTACPDFDANGSSTAKFAGISLSRGGAVIDPCFCQQFCSEIIDAVAAHEDRHFAFTLEALVDLMTSSIACSRAPSNTPMRSRPSRSGNRWTRCRPAILTSPTWNARGSRCRTWPRA
jgi:hypothetical protein